MIYRMGDILAEQLPRSREAEHPSYVTFCNRTKSPVDLVWRDYNGKCVRYHARVKPGSRCYMNTFESHPWQAWESKSHEPLLLGGSPIFYPRRWNGEEQRTVVYVDEPIRSLLHLCILKIKSLMDVDRVNELEIPHTLHHELRRKRRVEMRDHENETQS